MGDHAHQPFFRVFPIQITHAYSQTKRGAARPEWTNRHAGFSKHLGYNKYDPPYHKGGVVPQFHLCNLPHKRENEKNNWNRTF